MPFAKRSVSPVDVSQHRVPSNIRQNELDCVANGTMANLIRQLSSLSRHAEDIFGELYREAVKVEHKTTTLFNRIDRLAVKVTQLDSKIEEVSLQDLHLRKPFKSSSVIDQQSLSRHTMPAAMAECYSHCDPPPDLDKLNKYRDDGKSGLKFYTDPDYFFALWRDEMLKDAENVKRVHKTKNVSDKRRKPRHSHENRQKHYASHQMADASRMTVETENIHQQQLTQDQMGVYLANGRLQSHSHYIQQQTGVIRPESLELQYGTSGYGSMDSTGSSHNQQQLRLQQQQQQQQQYAPPPVAQQYAVINRNQPDSQQSAGTTPTAFYDLNQMSPRSQESTESGRSRSTQGQARPSQPPPAPPPLSTGASRGATANGDLPNRISELSLDGSPAPPPPPPPVVTSAGHMDRSVSPDLPPPPPPIASDSAPSAPSLSKSNGGPPPAPPPPPPLGAVSAGSGGHGSVGSVTVAMAGSSIVGDARTLDARSDLLKAIKQGIQLKKVDRQEEKERDDAAAEEGQDVAAILKRRMEGVMGRSDSEGSVSDFEDDWDD